MARHHHLQAAALLAGVLSFSVQAEEKPDFVDPFSLIDAKGTQHDLAYYEKDEETLAIALIAHSLEDEPLADRASRWQELASRAQGAGARLWWINVDDTPDADQIAAAMEAFGAPILLDPEQIVTRNASFTHVGEFALVDPEDQTVVARGLIGDGTALRNAFRGFVGDAPESRESNEGATWDHATKIAYKDVPEVPNYSDHIGPLLRDNCADCHRDGGVAPFALTSYRKARGWSEMMREVLMTRRMPPWQADPAHGQFKNDFSLTAEERRDIIAWIEAGSPRGEGPDPLESYTPIVPEWTFGEPDAIVEIPEQSVAAEGVFPYRYVRVQSPFDHDVWLSAVQVNPGNTSVLHHIIATALEPQPGGRPNRRHIAGYAPGMTAERFPEGTARLLKANATLLFQLHYTASGKDEIDRSTLGLYVMDQPPEKELRSGVIVHNRFQIPPGERAHEVTDTHKFNEDVLLYAMNPHMHLRGKSMRYEAIYPDGQTETLLNVPNYHFGWQRNYHLAQPKFLPKGTELQVTAAWDNSELNPYNPDPSEVVKWGDQTFEEMFYASFQYTHADDEELANGESPTLSPRARKFAQRLVFRALTR